MTQHHRTPVNKSYRNVMNKETDDFLDRIKHLITIEMLIQNKT